LRRFAIAVEGCKVAKEEGRMSLAVSTLLFVYTKSKAKTRILKHEYNFYVSAPAYRTSLQRRSGGTRTTFKPSQLGACGLAGCEGTYRLFRGP